MDLLAPVMTKPIGVWLLEDDPHYRQTVSYLVDHSPGMHCTKVFATGETLLDWLGRMDERSPPGVVLMDINLPGVSGIACISRVKARLPEAQIVMLTIQDNEETIFQAFRAGASGYLLKNSPLDVMVGGIREAARGGMLIPPQVARRVLRFFERELEPSADYGLTERELAVLRKMVEGYTQKEIGLQLFITTSTVNGHIQHIYEKLHVHSMSAAVAKAIRERLV